MLAEIYNWFMEGFDTKDLQEAKALLSELAGRDNHHPRVDRCLFLFSTLIAKTSITGLSQLSSAKSRFKKFLNKKREL